MNDTEKVYQSVGRPCCGLSNRKIAVQYHRGRGFSVIQSSRLILGRSDLPTQWAPIIKWPGRESGHSHLETRSKVNFTCSNVLVLN
jgi:hypothetical protein